MDSQIDKETADLLLNGVLNLHNRIISKKPHIKKYKKIKSYTKKFWIVWKSICLKISMIHLNTLTK